MRIKGFFLCLLAGSRYPLSRLLLALSDHFCYRGGSLLYKSYIYDSSCFLCDNQRVSVPLLLGRSYGTAVTVSWIEFRYAILAGSWVMRG